MSIITYQNGKQKQVKNLGWLLRNWQDVESFCFVYNPNTKTVCDGELIAWLKNGVKYSTDFASFNVCVDWLDRPIFKGKELLIHNLPLGTVSSYRIGWEEYLKFKKGNAEKKI